MNKKTWFRAAASLLGLTLLLVGAAGGGTSGSGEVVTDLIIPIDQTAFVENGDASEQVEFSGSIHIVVKFIPPDPIIPPNPIKIHTNMMGVSGTGQTSGLQYQLNGSANFELPANALDDFSFSGSYRVQPTPPPIKSNEELTQSIRYHLQLNESGNVSESTATVIDGDAGIDN